MSTTCENCRFWLEYESLPGLGCCNWHPTEPTPISYLYVTCAHTKAEDGGACPCWAVSDPEDEVA